MGIMMKNGEPYGGSYNSSDKISYNNADSGLSATNVKTAIDEVQAGVSELNSNLEWKYLGSVTGKGDVTTNFVSIEGYKEIHLVFYNEAQNSIISGITLTLPNVGAEVPIVTRRAGHYQNAENYAYVGIAFDYGSQKVYMGSYAAYALGKNVTTTTAMYVYGR